MKKNVVKLTESELKQIITESVKKIISELDWKTYQNAAKKDYNPNRARDFAQAARDTFNKDYEYSDDKGNYVVMRKSGLYDKDNVLGVNSHYEKPSKYGNSNVRFHSKNASDNDKNGWYSMFYNNTSSSSKKPTTIDKRHARKIQKAYDEFENYRNGNSKYNKGEGWDKPEQNDFHSFIDFNM